MRPGAVGRTGVRVVPRDGTGWSEDASATLVTTGTTAAVETVRRLRREQRRQRHLSNDRSRPSDTHSRRPVRDSRRVVLRFTGPGDESAVTHVSSAPHWAECDVPVLDGPRTAPVGHWGGADRPRPGRRQHTWRRGGRPADRTRRPARHRWGRRRRAPVLPPRVRRGGRPDPGFRRRPGEAGPAAPHEGRGAVVPLRCRDHLDRLPDLGAQRRACVHRLCARRGRGRDGRRARRLVRGHRALPPPAGHQNPAHGAHPAQEGPAGRQPLGLRRRELPGPQGRRWRSCAPPRSPRGSAAGSRRRATPRG